MAWRQVSSGGSEGDFTYWTNDQGEVTWTDPTPGIDDAATAQDAQFRQIWDSTPGDVQAKLNATAMQTGAGIAQVAPWAQKNGLATNADLANNAGVQELAAKGYPLLPDGQFADQNSGGALMDLAGSKLGSVLSGRAVLQGGIKEQDMSSANMFDVLGSPATAGTKQQDAARAAALAYGGYAAGGALAGALGSGSGAAAEGSVLGGAGDMFGSGAAYEAGAAGLGSGAATGTAAGGLIGTEAALGAGGGATGTVGAAGGAAGGGLGGATGGGAAVAGGTALSRVLGGTGSETDWASILGTLGATGLGVYGAGQHSDALRDIANQARADRAPFLNAATGWLANPDSYWQGPGKTALNANLRALSATGAGNPIDQPTSLGIASQAGLADWRNAVTGFGNLGLAGEDSRNNLMAGAAGAENGIYNSLGYGLSQLTNPPTTIEQLLKQMRGTNSSGLA